LFNDSSITSEPHSRLASWCIDGMVYFKHCKIMKKDIFEVIGIMLILFLILLAYVRFKTITAPKIANTNEQYEPFGVVVEESIWTGELEPGRYTKSGIKILKKNER